QTADRQKLQHNVVKIASYAAELMRDAWYQARRLGQRPLVRYREVIEAPQLTSATQSHDKSSGQHQSAQALVRPQEFTPAAANQVARVTRDTIRAIAFPTFVADLVNGTFNAIINANIRQMEAYTQLIANVGKTVDQFMNENISDNQARDWLVQ